jgi:catechol 2,3-dioxygenase-like lactoylglutathione lyase family enzyme
VKNIDSSAQWYQKNLGYKLDRKMQFPEYDSLQICFLKSSTFEIELVSKRTSFPIQRFVPDFDINKAPLQGLVKIAFQVANLETLYRQLKGREVKELLGISYDKATDSDFFVITDPDGNMLQFIRPRKPKR